MDAQPSLPLIIPKFGYSVKPGVSVFDLARFFKYVAFPDADSDDTIETGCWVWCGATSWNGYPLFRVGPAIVRAHRWFYQQIDGVVPLLPGDDLHHDCHYRPCVSLYHCYPVERYLHRRAALHDWRCGAREGARCVD